LEMKRCKVENDFAATVGAVAFGIFCLFAVIAGIVYIASLNNQAIPVSDSYGTGLDANSTAAKAAVIAMTAEEEASATPLLLLAGAIMVCVVVFVAWVASKTGISV
jgi:hypothetical protein